MGKRSNFERNPRDYYRTPEKAVLPLLPHLDMGSPFVEPCAGDGCLVDHLERAGLFCDYKSDIEPQSKDIWKRDALLTDWSKISPEYFITNPPWDCKILHPMIEHFRQFALTWLLFDADWMHTKQARPYLKFCHKIVSVGRVSWMENGTSGKDNCAWYLFNKQESETVFYNEGI